MNKYYKLFICVLLGLFLMGTGTYAVAEPQNETKTIKKYNYPKRTYQGKTFPKKKYTKPPTVKQPVQKRKTQKQHYRQNTARDALRSGRIVSLGVIRQRVRQSFPGKIVDVRLQEPRSNNRNFIYKVKVLRKDGKLLELKINAANGSIVGVKGNK
ncbi:MAG: hypothetical protein KAI89_10645 [Emcibacter sp.]|nr:hypothetical protein [Emcibacter sp.]